MRLFLILLFLFNPFLKIVHSDEMDDLKNYARNVQVLSNIYQESMYVYDIYADIDIKVDQFRNGSISKNEFLKDTKVILDQINIININFDKILRETPSTLNLDTSSMQKYEEIYNETYQYLKLEVSTIMKKDLSYYEQMITAAQKGNFDLADDLFFKYMDNGINMLIGENRLLSIQNSISDSKNPRFNMNDSMSEMNNSFIFFYSGLKSAINGEFYDYNEQIFGATGNAYQHLNISESNLDYFDGIRSELIQYEYYDYVEIIDEMLRIFEIWILSEKDFIDNLEFIYAKYDLNNFQYMSVSEIEELMNEYEKDSIVFNTYLENRFRYSNQILELGQSFN